MDFTYMTCEVQPESKNSQGAKNLTIYGKVNLAYHNHILRCLPDAVDLIDARMEKWEKLGEGGKVGGVDPESND